MTSHDDVFHEGVTMRIAFVDLVSHVCVRDTDPDEVSISEVLAGLDEFGVCRFGGLLFAFKEADTIEEGIDLAMEVQKWLREGRRPRGLQELLPPPEPSSADSWWQRTRERAARVIVADEATSRRLDVADQAMRLREGRQP